MAKKLKLPKKLKLEYLREIDRNLVLHCMQPNDTAEGYAHYSIYQAPAVLLARMVYTLGTISKHYAQALKLRIKVERASHGKKGLDKQIAEAAVTIRELGSQWNPKGGKKAANAVADTLEMIHKKLSKKKKK